MDLLTITHFLNGFLMIALPIVLGILLTHKFHLGWKLWLIGGATYIISQVFHIPFNSYLLNPLLGTIQQVSLGVPSNLAVGILLGLSAGIFEECARYGMFRWWLKDARSWKSAILAGAGHGGIEAIILGGLVMWGFINLTALRYADLSKLNLSADQLPILKQQLLMYWSIPWYNTLFGAVERIFTIPYHIMASVLVMQVFTRRPGQQQLRWLLLAIFLHATMNASAYFLAGYWRGYAVEAVLGALAVMDILIIFALRQPEPEPSVVESIQPHAEPLVHMPKPIEETAENLENTRYQ